MKDKQLVDRNIEDKLTRMADAQPIRVVPNGKVYRQMFDAQLQLSKCLSKVASQDRSLPALFKLGEIERSKLPASAPVVHLTREDTHHGMLSGRQRTWAEGFPNDPYTENPILYKQYKDFVFKQLHDSESTEAGKEVRGLPEKVVPAKEGSDIIERIASSRKARHEAAVEDMHQALGVISSEIEPKIVKASEETLQILGEGDVKITHLLEHIENDEDLLSYSLQDLKKLWDEVAAFSPQRQELISELDTRLKALEEERMQQIRKVFQEYAKMFEKISHLLAPDLQRFMGRESQAINQTCLSNRRAYADLYVRLMSADMEREKTQHTGWRRRLQDWKTLKTTLAVGKFREFMHSEEIMKPPGVEQVLDCMVTELAVLNQQRLDLVQSLSELRPPASTKSAVYKWRQQMQKVTQELDAVTQMHMSKLHQEMENVCRTCLEKVEEIKQELLQTGVVSESRAKQVVEEQMLPLVGEQQRIFEQNLETMEKTQEAHAKQVEEDLHSLFKFSQGMAHLWDVHEIGLARQERALQEKLEECRHDHDYVNQVAEANLDLVMDRMRQDATEEALRESLGKVLEMLGKIQESYQIFYQDQLDIVNTYPDMVQSELNNFDSSVCQFFTVDRTHPEEKERIEQEAAATVEESDTLNQAPSRPSSLTSVPSARSASTRKNTKKKLEETSQEQSTTPVQSLRFVVAEILSTEKGTTFYVLTVAAEHDALTESEESETTGAGGKPSAEAGAFMTEVATLAEEYESKPQYISSVDIPLSHIVDVKKIMRLNFLNHMESWCEQAKERASSVVVAKSEELNSELDLRLHLHQPRSRRAELDVHNVRAAELVMHAERVTRHCKGIGQSQTELCSRFSAMSSQHNNLTQKFRQDIEALEIIFINATKSSRLVALQNQLSVELEKYMSVIRTSLRQFRQHLDETLQMLRESNARFIKSFKLFSDGGNFCPEEIEEYRKKLERMSNKINSSEGSIMSELEGMESKRLDFATKASNEFEDRFKSHMFDLLFMEKVARWLTNTQVKIKAEVAASNSQAQALAKHIADLERRIDACEKPNLDKEHTTPAELNSFLKTAMEAFHSRSEYLNCLKGPQTRPSSPAPQNPPASKVGFSSDAGGPSKGKQTSEDPSVSVIKNILRTQKAKMHFGLDAEFDGDYASQGLAPTPTSYMPGAEASREKTKSALSQNSNKINGSDKGGVRRSIGNVPQTASDTATSGGLRRIPSGGGRRGMKAAAGKDKKQALFGEGIEDTGKEENNFMGSIQRTLREAIDGLLHSAEAYYKQKGARAVTRPQVLQETFEECQVVITNKIQSYYAQCEDYHNQCLQEFRQQLVKVEQLGARVPPLIINGLVTQHVHRAQAAHKQLQAEFQANLDRINARQMEHENSLRPNMGHPHLAPQLEVLCGKESQRHDEYHSAVAKLTKSLQTCAVEHAKTLLDALSRLAEQQLLQFDRLLVVDDVEKGRVEPTKYPTSELIRRKNAGEPMEDEEDKDALPRGKGNWLGMPSNQLVAENRPAKPLLTPTVQTAKTTLGHSSTVKARDSAYGDYKAQFEGTLVMIEDEKNRLARDEEHWTNSWQTSVQRIKDLYRPL